MARASRERDLDRPARAGLGEVGTRLYELVLDERCLCLTQLLTQLRPFTNRGIVELLSRTSGIADRLESVAYISLSANTSPGTVHYDR